jgi:cytochrome c553
MTGRLPRTLLGVVLLAIVLVEHAAFAQLQTPHAPDSMQERMRACTPCHGKDGAGTSSDYFPRIAGQPADYLYEQLLGFHNDQRHYAPMNYLLEFLPASYLKKIAAFFAAQHPPAPPPLPAKVSAAVLARGNAIVFDGDPAHHVPSCVSCHGKALTGMEPDMPSIVGLRADYISSQLGAVRYRSRNPTASTCMQQIVAHMSAEDITAVTAWLSSQPVPADARPLPPGALTLPIPCASAAQ